MISLTTKPNLLLNIGKELTQLGHEVSIMMGTYSSFKETYTSKGMKITKIPSLPIPLFRLESDVINVLTTLLATERAEIFHFFGLYPFGQLLPFVKGILKKPVVLTVQGAGFHSIQKSKILKVITRETLKCVDGVTVVCNDVKRGMLSLGVHPSKISVVHHGLNSSLFSSADGSEIRKHNLSNDEKLILTVGRLTHSKGIQVLLYAFKLLFNRNKELKLMIVGDGPLKQKLKNLRNKLGLQDHVIFAGFVPYNKVANYMMASDIFVISSLAEGLPKTLFEATYCGKPVVATNCGGIGEFINSVKNGLIVPPGDPYALADALRYIIVTEEIRNRFVKNAMLNGKREINSWMDVAKGYERVYNKICS